MPESAPLPTYDAWQEALLDLAEQRGLAPAAGFIAGSDRAVSAVADKLDLRETSGAVAVDMESHGVAQVAWDAGLPFLVVRAVADPAGRPLPRSVLGSIRADGTPRGGLVALRLSYRPWEIPAVNRLRQDARTALRALGAFTRTLGPELLRVDR